MNPFLQVTTTVEHEEDAIKMAQSMVSEQLAACVQISTCHSIYRWQENVESAVEYTLVLKTRQDLFPALKQAIKAMHPYEVPEIIATKIIDINQEYQAWLNTELKA